MQPIQGFPVQGQFVYQPGPYIYQLNQVPAPGLEINFNPQGQPMQCKSCGAFFTQHTTRKGISGMMLFLIIILSCFIFLFLLLIFFMLERYQVCPYCNKPSGHAGSNQKNICFC